MDCGDSHHARHYRHSGVMGGDTDWVCSKCVAKDDIPLSDSDHDQPPDQTGHDQPQGGPEPVPLRAPLPSFMDSWPEFDQKMDDYGFERSPTQQMTTADGNCAIYGNI